MSLSLLPKISKQVNLIKSFCKFSLKSFGTFINYLIMLIVITFVVTWEKLIYTELIVKT